MGIRNFYSPGVWRGNPFKISKRNNECACEADIGGKLWTVTTEPRMMCGTWVVWLEGFSGCFDCQYLQVVKEDE